MTLYIRRMNDWMHMGAFPCVSWDVPIASDNSKDGGSIVIEGERKDFSGNWAILNGNLYYINKCNPSNGITTLTVSEAANALDRSIVYDGDGTETFGAFLVDTITDEFIDQEDEAYSLPYLTVTSSDSTSFEFPAKSGEVFNLSDILATAKSKDIIPIWVASINALSLEFRKITPSTKIVLAGDGHNYIVSETYNSSITEKVTVREKREEEDESITILSTETYYWNPADGTVVSEPPTERANGKWEIVDVKEGESLFNAAVDAMQNNSRSYKVEFYSDKDFAFHDFLRIKTESGIQSGKVSYIKESSKDSRKLYKIGRAITTITEKLAQEDKK